MSITVENDLKEILGEIKTQLNDLQKDVTSLKINMATVKTELSAVGDDVRDLKGLANAQIWTLILAVIGAVITPLVRFGIFPNP
ncbi:hemolysin XhlA family protein [Synechocystis sp. FACHB-383]|nr:hemolysin XhlA family protein [Synechocystis sp. FACHB-383]